MAVGVYVTITCADDTLTALHSMRTTQTNLPVMANGTHMATRARMDKPVIPTIKIPRTTLATHTPRDSMTDKDMVRFLQSTYIHAGLIVMLEMSNVNGSGPDRILNECREINELLAKLDNRQEQLKASQKAFLQDTTSSPESQSAKKVNEESAALLGEYRSLVARTKRIKQDRESGNPRNAAQVGKVDRSVKASMNKFQQLDSEFRKDLEQRMKRDYRIVRPDASDAEVQEAIQDPNQQIFSQALINSDRRGLAQTTAQSVRARHTAIQKIEQDMIQLAEMFQDLDALVIQQEAAVTSIEQRGEEVTDHATKANTELTGAVDKARAARKKKWICLGIAGESFSLLCLSASCSSFLSHSRLCPLLFSNLYFSCV